MPLRLHKPGSVSGKGSPQALAQEGPRREPPVPRGLNALSHEAVKRIGPERLIFPHFGIGPLDDQPGFDVLPAISEFVAMEARAHARWAGSAHLAFINTGMRSQCSG